ncbi:MAG: 4Fe-4S binding protein [Lachnospiraceae bacterium]|nr:4Fe-4S binding protein [Lachnospiraceae bacterium]MCI1726987.1 4Fe-4S binding protein [Lachnospiraceae bacterium]
MDKLLTAVKNHIRTVVQILFTALTNGYARGFAEGSIFRGPSKAVCVPGLNCYSCPGALGACPIGSLQATLDSGKYHIAFYVAGFLLFIGAVFGRFVCGWLCPFGLVQDLLYKIPFVRKMKKLPGDRFLRFLKYGILAGFVIILPMTVLDLAGQGQPWFCEYICPSGTLFAGIPLVASTPVLQSALGFLFSWKLTILIVLLLLSILVYRPFCKYLCPLGAIYGFFNPVALYRFRIEEDQCTKCGLCRKACGMDIPVYQKPNSFECIRCGDCRKACPHHAITIVNLKRSKENHDS